MIYNRRRIAATREQQALFSAAEAARSEPGKAEPFEKAVKILDRVGARQWRTDDGQWCISVPRDFEMDEEVCWAVGQLEEEAGMKAILIWSRRKDEQ